MSPRNKNIRDHRRRLFSQFFFKLILDIPLREGPGPVFAAPVAVDAACVPPVAVPPLQQEGLAEAVAAEVVAEN